MNYQNTAEFAEKLDNEDPFKDFRKLFYVPKHKETDAVYFCGNSLGLQPITAREHVSKQFEIWKDIAIEGFFQGDDPWLSYHKGLTQTLAGIVGALPDEVSIMNSLTVNLHLLMVSFYRPKGKRFRIIMEAGAFPSDQYAVESQARFHGYDPSEAIIEIKPRPGEYTLRTEDILYAIADNADNIALVLFGGVNYFTGQFFDLQAITKAAHQAGAVAGFDLAHAAGNVELRLHNWNVDFAAWCSYKYLNSGPGGISGVFVNQKHFDDNSLNRFAGWWGYKEDKRFQMSRGFIPDEGAAGWQVSTSPVMLLALHKASLQIFEKAGTLSLLREKSILLTGYLEFVLKSVNEQYGEEIFIIITPKNQQERGCQLSIICKQDARQIFSYLTGNGVVGDWREPNVIRLSPVPLYNTFTEVYRTGVILTSAIKEFALQGF